MWGKGGVFIFSFGRERDWDLMSAVRAHPFKPFEFEWRGFKPFDWRDWVHILVVVPIVRGGGGGAW
jgi:hypothetical protein